MATRDLRNRSVVTDHGSASGRPDPKDMVTSDEDEESQPASRIKYHEAHVHFGKCLLLAIQKKFHVVLEFLEPGTGMIGLVAKYTPELLEIRGILWAYARKGKETRGYIAMDNFVRGMNVRAFFSQSRRKEKAYIRYVGASGEDANVEFEKCATRIAAEHKKKPFHFHNFAQTSQILAEGFADIPRLFNRGTAFEDNDGDAMLFGGTHPKQITAMNVPVHFETDEYKNHYFFHITGSDHRGTKFPCLFEVQSQKLVKDVLKKEERQMLGEKAKKTNDCPEGSSAPSMKRVKQNDKSSTAKSTVPLICEKELPTESSKDATNKKRTAVADVNSEIANMPDENGAVHINENLHIPEESGLNMTDLFHDKAPSRDASVIRGETPTEPCRPLSALLDEEDDSNSQRSSDSQRHPPQSPNSADSTASNLSTQGTGPLKDSLTDISSEGLGTSVRSSQCDTMDSAEFELREMQASPYKIFRGTKFKEMNSSERNAKLRYYRDKRNYFSQKYTVPKGEISFSFLAKNIEGRPDAKDYAGLNGKNRIYILCTQYAKAVKGTLNYCTSPEALYNGVMWRDLMTCANRRLLAVEKKDGQGFANIFDGIFKDVWGFVKDVARERTRNGEKDGSVWHINNFPDDKVKREVYRKEQTGFAAKVNRIRQIVKRGEIERKHGSNGSGDVDSDANEE